MRGGEQLGSLGGHLARTHYFVGRVRENAAFRSFLMSALSGGYGAAAPQDDHDDAASDNSYVDELHEELQAQMDAREAAENRVAELEREVKHLLKEVEKHKSAAANAMKNAKKQSGSQRVSALSSLGEVNNSHMSFIQSVELFQSLSDDQMRTLLQSTSLVEYAEGEDIIRQGEPGDAFYIIVSGKVAITREVDDYSDLSGLLTNKDAGGSFGERALMLDEPRFATCTSVNTTRCLRLERHGFNEALSNVGNLMGDQLDSYSYYQSEMSVKGLTEYAKVNAAQDLPLGSSSHACCWLFLALIQPRLTSSPPPFVFISAGVCGVP